MTSDEREELRRLGERPGKADLAHRVFDYIEASTTANATTPSLGYLSPAE